MDGERLSSSQLAAVRTLVVGGTTAEVMPALAAAGIRALLLKGPVFEQLLFDADEVRPYADTDVLVAPGDAGRAAAVLRGLGFTTLATAPIAARNAQLWTRGREEVDLHAAMWAVEADPSAAWSVFCRDARRVTVGRLEVETLSVPATAMHVALHAALHARTELKVIEDLERALARVDRKTWEAARDLAEALGAAASMAAGLRRLPAGAELARELGMAERPPVAAQLMEELRPGTIRYIVRLGATPGVRAKLALVPGALFPPREWMERRPLGRRGRLGLALAYAARLLRGAARILPSLLVLARMRRRAG